MENLEGSIFAWLFGRLVIAEALLKDLNKKTPKQAAKSELDKEILIEDPKFVPSLKSR